MIPMISNLNTASQKFIVKDQETFALLNILVASFMKTVIIHNVIIHNFNLSSTALGKINIAYLEMNIVL